MKWSKTKSLITLLVLAGLSLVSWTLYRYYNEQYYKQFRQYTGKAEIDDYEIIADGSGAIVHWTSTTPEEDKKMEEFGHYSFFLKGKSSSHYILRQNMKLKDNPYYLKERAAADEYWTLSIYHLKDKKLEEEKELDLYKVVEDYHSDYIPADLGAIYTWRGQEYLKIQIRDLKNPQEPTRPLFLNLKNRKIEEIETLAQNDKRKPRISFGVALDNAKSSVSSIPEFDRREILINKNALKKTQFKQGSKAYQLLEEKGSNVFVFTSYNSAEQFSKVAAVYRLFMSDDINIFENTTIPSELSIDSQEHIVNSKEEFDRYYDIEKAKKAYHETE